MINHILNHLPYKSSFRFVDNITYLNENEVKGEYTLKQDSFFYEDHFEGNPVTPGVIITEIMAQIGLVVLGIFLILKETDHNFTNDDSLFPLLTSTDVSFYKMVLPGQKVTVISKKQYFRFGKLKCYVEMLDSEGELVAKGTFSGIIKKIAI
ncbi:MAG: hydroxymyristoyl-ACP dehydratase [Mucilaginibacter sp.]|jgi:3-hydroxyacyl-[acyl-carrier-protein] dehydratase|nr:hydroxymyristoyl-ACP dehydratase [Mucilaginibacter sp.]MDB5061937.1 hydroxymyristoyl-ACP dehydratase [Mucilaginibacter sp.]